MQNKNQEAAQALSDLVTYFFGDLDCEDFFIQVEVAGILFGVPVTRSDVDLQGLKPHKSALPSFFRHRNLDDFIPLATFIRNWPDSWSLFESLGKVCELAIQQQPGKFHLDVLRAGLKVLKGRKRMLRLDPELKKELSNTSPEEFEKVTRALGLKLRIRSERRSSGADTQIRSYIASSRSFLSSLPGAPCISIAVDAGTGGQQNNLLGAAEMLVPGAGQYTVWLAPQVLRALQTASNLKEVPAEVDIAEWQEKLKVFFKAPKKEKETGKPKRAATRERVAACDFMRALDNSLAVSFGIRLHHYWPSKPKGADSKEMPRQYAQWNADDADEEPDECTPDPSLPSRPFLSIIMDEGSSNWSAGWFLQNHLKMDVLLTRDCVHRSVNDWKLALRAAGMRSTAPWRHFLHRAYTEFGPPGVETFHLDSL